MWVDIADKSNIGKMAELVDAFLVSEGIVPPKRPMEDKMEQVISSNEEGENA